MHNVVNLSLPALYSYTPMCLPIFLFWGSVPLSYTYRAPHVPFLYFLFLASDLCVRYQSIVLTPSTEVIRSGSNTTAGKLHFGLASHNVPFREMSYDLATKCGKSRLSASRKWFCTSVIQLALVPGAVGQTHGEAARQ